MVVAGMLNKLDVSIWEGFTCIRLGSSGVIYINRAKHISFLIKPDILPVNFNLT